ncbi:hypothetical protein ABXN37_15930 [Piscinibacter sakaiensis]|uniref:Uncharacterized protein n=1 Tax=Piscinibacter sakaiensis TaxID=1547922 RepID=A0A0K8P1W8_PISS1|nr:hypothetical protein [Piscinibacter sakaiensis]GAP36636.1 hypothetical protein ISF6_2476 [Piscinibacter sakaiensis]
MNAEDFDVELTCPTCSRHFQAGVTELLARPIATCPCGQPVQVDVAALRESLGLDEGD